MVAIFFPLLMILNFGISWWNARSVGRIWSESKEVGGSLRVTAIAGYAMSIAGFTMVYGLILMFLAPFILPMVSEQFNQPQLQYQVLTLASDMLYVLVIVTILPAGYIIWFQSVKTFFERKTIRTGLVAGWNTFAAVSNTINAARGLPSAVGRIKNALSDQRGNSAIVFVAIIIVLCAVLGGYFTASTIMKRADRNYDAFSDLKQRVQANPMKYEKLAKE